VGHLPLPSIVMVLFVLGMLAEDDGQHSLCIHEHEAGMLLFFASLASSSRCPETATMERCQA
jgi:hypothetical protein